MLNLKRLVSQRLGGHLCAGQISDCVSLVVWLNHRHEEKQFNNQHTHARSNHFSVLIMAITQSSMHDKHKQKNKTQHKHTSIQELPLGHSSQLQVNRGKCTCNFHHSTSGLGSVPYCSKVPRQMVHQQQLHTHLIHRQLYYAQNKHIPFQTLAAQPYYYQSHTSNAGKKLHTKTTYSETVIRTQLKRKGSKSMPAKDIQNIDV